MVRLVERTVVLRLSVMEKMTVCLLADIPSLLSTADMVTPVGDILHRPLHM